MIDLDAIQSRLDRGVESLTDTYDLLREVKRLRGEVEQERVAVVTWLRADGFSGIADHIERGEHRREENE